MPSRKRDKGRARKAKAKAKDTQSDPDANENEDEPKELIVLRSWFTRRLQDVATCSHDCPPLPAGHVGNKLLDAIVNRSYKACMGDLSEEKRTGQTLTRAFDEFESKHPEIWSDCSMRALIKKSLMGRSFDIVLQYEDEGRLMAAGMLASAAILLELDPNSCELTEEVTVKKQLRIADVLEGDKKSLINFFSKRIACPCINKMRKDPKCQSKTGLCKGCYERFDRNQLFVCSRCKTKQYCSNSCQKKHWPEHKKECKKVT